MVQKAFGKGLPGLSLRIKSGVQFTVEGGPRGHAVFTFQRVSPSISSGKIWDSGEGCVVPLAIELHLKKSHLTDLNRAAHATLCFGHVVFCSFSVITFDPVISGSRGLH